MTKTPKPGQRVLAALRRMIVTGEIPDGARIAEIPTAEALGVSRMPVRTALRALAVEGLVVPLGARGYAARGPTRPKLEGAVQVRGVLEGLAARLAACLPDHAQTGAGLVAAIAPCAGLFASGALDDLALNTYFEANAAFHDQLVAASGNEAIAMALAQNNHLPMASAGAFAFDVADRARACALLERAHGEHLAVAHAIAAGQPDRAEALMRAHADVSLAFEQGLVD